jgi:hypothetical protein
MGSGQLPRRRVQTSRPGLCDIGQNATRVLHRDQRIAVDICVGRDRRCFIRAERRRSLLR